MSADDKILDDFQFEARRLITEMKGLASSCLGDPARAPELAQYGQMVDRIMGASRSLPLVLAQKVDILDQIGDFTALCKEIAYKASQIQGDDFFYSACVSFLIEATTVLDKMFGRPLVAAQMAKVNEMDKKFLDQITWILDHFSNDVRGTLGAGEKQSIKLDQVQIDDLLKKIGQN